MALSGADPLIGRMAIEACVIRLHDAWARFCRELVVVSAYRQPLTAQGVSVTRVVGLSRRRDVIPALLSTYKKKRNEPAWAIPTFCIDAAQRLGVSNYGEINSGIGLSISPSPTDQLRHVRNFVAHRSEETAQNVRQVARDLRLPIEPQAYAVASFSVKPNFTENENWAMQLRMMAGLAIQ